MQFAISADQDYRGKLCTSQARIQDFGKGGGAWGVGDKLAVRSSQVCAPGGSEGMPPRNF